MTLSAKCKQGDPRDPCGLRVPRRSYLSPAVRSCSGAMPTHIGQVTEHTHASLANKGLSPSHSSQRALWLRASRSISKGGGRTATLCSPGRPRPNKS